MISLIGRQSALVVSMILGVWLLLCSVTFILVVKNASSNDNFINRRDICCKLIRDAVCLQHGLDELSSVSSLERFKTQSPVSGIHIVCFSYIAVITRVFLVISSNFCLFVPQIIFGDQSVALGFQ